MIGRLDGILIEKSPDLVMVDVSGVGYEVQVSLTTYVNLPGNNQKVILLTHMVVREDAQLLFGFLTGQERDLFRVLIKVNGVGPKLGLTILSGMDAMTFARCVKNNDVSSLVSLPGVGKKTAERLVIEVRDKLKDWQGLEDFDVTQTGLPKVDHLHDAETALVGLGYRPQDAARVLARMAVSDSEEESVEKLIKMALKELSN